MVDPHTIIFINPPEINVIDRDWTWSTTDQWKISIKIIPSEQIRTRLFQIIKKFDTNLEFGFKIADGGYNSCSFFIIHEESNTKLILNWNQEAETLGGYDLNDKELENTIAFWMINTLNDRC